MKIALLLALEVGLWAQAQPLLRSGAVGPATAADITALFSGCSGSNYLGADGACHANGGGSVPSGLITLVLSGTCSAGWSEVSALNGKTLIGTVAANGDVGATGGADSITPAGTNSAPAFTGTSSQVTSATSGGTPAGTNSAPTFTGSSTTVPAETISGSTAAEAAHTHSVTAAGTNGTVSITPLGTNANESAHTHTYTDVPNHVHVENINTATTGGAAGFPALVDTSTSGSSALGLSTANNTGGVATGTTAAGSAHTHTFTGSSTTVGAETFTGSQVTSGAGSSHVHAVGTLVNASTTLTPLGTVAAPTFTGSALATHTHTLTPGGTVAAPSFSGTAFDNRSAFVKVIFCSKD